MMHPDKSQVRSFRSVTGARATRIVQQPDVDLEERNRLAHFIRTATPLGHDAPETCPFGL